MKRAGDTITPSPGTPGEGWGGGSVKMRIVRETPSLTLPRSTGGGNKRSVCRVLQILSLIFFLATAIGCQSDKQFDFTQPKMGTLFHMTLYAPSEQVANRAAAAAWARVDELNSIL